MLEEYPAAKVWVAVRANVASEQARILFNFITSYLFINIGTCCGVFFDYVL